MWDWLPNLSMSNCPAIETQIVHWFVVSHKWDPISVCRLFLSTLKQSFMPNNSFRNTSIMPDAVCICQIWRTWQQKLFGNYSFWKYIGYAMQADDGMDGIRILSVLSRHQVLVYVLLAARYTPASHRQASVILQHFCTLHLKVRSHKSESSIVPLRQSSLLLYWAPGALLIFINNERTTWHWRPCRLTDLWDNERGYCPHADIWRSVPVSMPWYLHDYWDKMIYFLQRFMELQFRLLFSPALDVPDPTCSLCPRILWQRQLALWLFVCVGPILNLRSNMSSFCYPSG